MADIQYLNYGNQQIEQQALLNNLANEVQGYVNKQPWSTKRKEKFMSAYSDIMNRGIIGASNNTGQWVIDVNGQDIDLDSMDRKDREMYQEAAYFIQQQMAGLPTKTSEEEKKTEDLPVFDFNKDFITHVNNSINGGQPLNIGYGDTDQWNYLDERDSNGIRGRKNRANKLAELLESYKTKLGDGSKYKFEGSPYSDINDFTAKIDKAIAALKTDSIDDDREALQAIGLNQATWFNNGSGDPSGKVDAEGNSITYGQLAQYNKALAEQKEKEQAAIAQQNKIKNSGVLSISSNNNPVDAIYNSQKYQEYLGQTYGVGQQGFNAINNKIQELLEKSYNNGRSNGLNSAERKQLGNLIHYIRTNNPNYQNYNLSKQDESELSKHENLKGKRLQDFIRLPWQTSDGRYTYADKSGNIYFLKPQNQTKLAAPTFQRSAAYNNYRNNFLFNTNAGNKAAQNAYLNQEGAENAELYGIAADIASIIDPEPFSAMGLSLSAAAARNYAGLQQPGKWSLKDYGSQGLDYLTSVIGAIPVVGDAALAEKVIKNLRRLGRFGAWSDIVQSTPGLVDIWNNKIMGDQKMTKQDWRTIGTALRGLVSHGRLNQSNLAARTVMKQRGLETGNAWHQRSGFTSSAKSTNKTDVLKVTKNGKSEEIDITAKEKQDLKEAFKKAKPSERTEKAREILGKDRVPEGAEVKVSDGIRSTLRNWNRFTRRTSDSFGTNSIPVTRENIKSDEEFENFLQGRSTWNKIGLGSNRYLRRIDKQLNLNSNSVNPQNSSETPTNSSESSVNIPKGRLTKEEVTELRETLKGKKFGTAEFQDANFDIKNLGNIQFTTAKDGTRELKLTLKDGTILSQKSSYLDNTKLENLRFLKNNLRKIAEQLPKNQKAKINFELIKQLKKVGALKQGGTIDKQRIQRYKEFINK